MRLTCAVLAGSSVPEGFEEADGLVKSGADFTPSSLPGAGVVPETPALCTTPLQTGVSKDHSAIGK